MKDYLTVVFRPCISPAERKRLLDSLGNRYSHDETEAGAFCVEVPKETILDWALRYAALSPGIQRVSYCRLGKVTVH